jgi:hypothetical protein
LFETLAKGTYEVAFHKDSFNANSLSSNVYVFTIESGEFVEIVKVVILK